MEFLFVFVGIVVGLAIALALHLHYTKPVDEDAVETPAPDIQKLVDFLQERFSASEGLTQRRLGTMADAISKLSHELGKIARHVKPHPTDGAGLIHAERLRQVEIGHTPEKDDLHDSFLVWAAHDRMETAPAEPILATRRKLVIQAGALCAAELDRLQRVEDLLQRKKDAEAQAKMDAALEGRE